MPAAWGGFDDERVEALKLNFETVRAGSEASLYAEVKSAIERKEPILAWLYEPHWAPIRFDGNWVQMPKYEDACYNDPTWGVNPDKACPAFAVCISDPNRHNVPPVHADRPTIPKTEAGAGFPGYLL